MAVHDDDLGRAGRLRAAHGRIDLPGVEPTPFLVERLASGHLLPLHDSGDALHVADDVDTHAFSLRITDSGLEDKGVLVTGASGGIGSACARAFAAEGARVLLHHHQGHERARALAAELGNAPTARADLTVEEDVDSLFAEARATLGRVDVCVAVAGVWPSEDVPLWELSLERWEHTLRANLTATFLTARGFLREVERTGHGSLVLVGSTAGVFGEAGHADYSAAKAAILVGLLLSLKNEIVRIAPQARVNAVAPGWTESPMTRGHVDPESVARITRTMPLRKVAQPDDVARQVVVLASDVLSGHVSGQVVLVAGGMEGRVVHES
jgi:3-oxoacyl-[acyl-carrier protein] reductase